MIVVFVLQLPPEDSLDPDLQGGPVPLVERLDDGGAQVSLLHEDLEDLLVHDGVVEPGGETLRDLSTPEPKAREIVTHGKTGAGCPGFPPAVPGGPAPPPPTV